MTIKVVDKEGAQAILEFTFAMIILMLLIFAIVRVLEWTGHTLVGRRIAHENVLILPAVESYVYLPQCGITELRPIDQIDPYFYKQPKMKPVWGE